MLQSIYCCQPLTWVHPQELFQKVQSLWRQLSQISFVNGLQVLNIREFHPQKPWIFKECLIMVRSQRTKALLNQEQLIQLILPGKHWVSVYELSKDASYCPYIYLFRVGSSYKQFWRSIPSSCYVVCELFIVGRSFQLSGKPKITYFQLLSITDQQILRFYVSVDAVKRVHVGQSLEQLVHQQSDKFWFKTIRRFLKYFQKVVLNVLEYKIDDAFLSEGLLEFNDVGVPEQFEYFNLSHGCFFDDLIFFRFFEFFDSNYLFIVVALAFEHNPIGSLPDHTHNVIFLHIKFYHYNFTPLIQLKSQLLLPPLNYLLLPSSTHPAQSHQLWCSDDQF